MVGLGLQLKSTTLLPVVVTESMDCSRLELSKRVTDFGFNSGISSGSLDSLDSDGLALDSSKSDSVDFSYTNIVLLKNVIGPILKGL